MKHSDNFKLPFPEAGASAYLYLDFNTMEYFGGRYGDNWREVVVMGLSGGSSAIVADGLRYMLFGEDENALDDLPWGMTSQEIGARLLDAFSLAISGKTRAEIAAEKESAARIEARKVEAA